jgi:ubiquinone/menaquinone biosynthesis C-methylase UbiE
MSDFDHFSLSQGTAVGRWIKRRSRLTAYRKINSHLTNLNAKILELGAGWGDLAICFRNGGYGDCTLVEPNPTMYEHLNSLGFKTKDYRIPAIKESDSSYDVILLADVFEHLNGSTEAENLISEAHRVLRPGGILCILAPDYLHWQSEFFNCDYSHSNITTVRRLIQIFHNSGLQTLAYVYYSGFVFGITATLLSWIIRCVFLPIRGNHLNSRLYKLKVTFLRQFLIIAKKVGR